MSTQHRMVVTSPLRHVWPLILTGSGMVVYGMINIFIFAGYFSAAFLGFMSGGASVQERLVEFFIPYGGGACALIPIAYRLLHTPKHHRPVPHWRQTLLPLWLGFVTYVGLHPLLWAGLLLLPRRSLGGWPVWLDIILLILAMVTVAVVCWLLLHWHWFSAGLLPAFIITLPNGGGPLCSKDYRCRSYTPQCASISRCSAILAVSSSYRSVSSSAHSAQCFAPHRASRPAAYGRTAYREGPAAGAVCHDHSIRPDTAASSHCQIRHDPSCEGHGVR